MNKRRFLALVLVIVILSLSGCAGNKNGTITLITPEDYNRQQNYTEDNYPSIDYYAPDTDYTKIQPAPNADIAPGEDSNPEEITQYTRNTSSSTSYYPGQSGVFTYGIVTDKQVDIHPLRTEYRDMYSVNHLIFEGLVELDENLEPQPCLASDWSFLENVWSFTLRQDVKFHNGKNLTSADVMASYNEIMRHPGTHWYELCQCISGMQAPDDYTIQILVKDTAYYALYAMTFPVVESSTINSLCYGLDMPMGTGPYWIINYVAETRLELESNANWWKRTSGTFTKINVLFYKKISSALTAIELSEVDAIATDYPTASLSKNLSDRMTISYSTLSYECLVPNLRGAILSDLNVRMAIMYAIDRTTLGNTSYAGLIQESEVPVIPGSFQYNAQATKYIYNPELALKILNDDGWEDVDGDGILEKELAGNLRKLSLRLYTYDRGTTSTRTEAANQLKDQMALVGIEVVPEIKTLEEAQQALTAGEFDLVLCSFETYESSNLAFLFSSTGNCNYSRYNSRAMDDAIHEAYFAKDVDTLTSGMKTVQMCIVNDLPILGLFFRTGIFISRTSIGNLKTVWEYDVLNGLAIASNPY